MPDSPMPQPSSPNSKITAPQRSTALRVLKRLLAVVVIAGIGVWGLHWYATGGAGKKDSSAKTNEASVPVDVAAAEQEDFPVYLNGLGVVQGWNTVTIRARVDGQIDKIAFKEGQMVKQGDLLLQIDPRPFQAILDQAIAKKALDEALLANSKRDLERYRTVGTLAVSQQQIDTQAALVKQQEAQINSDQGAIDNAQVQLSYTTITAPIAGRMGFRMVDRGNIVHASDQQGVAIITQVQPIAVIFTAPEDELPRITAGVQAGPLPVTSLTSDVVELRLETDGAARGVDLVVDERERSAVKLDLTVRSECGDGERSCLHASGYARQLVLWRRKDDGNGLDLRDDRYALLVAGMNDVAAIHHAEAHSPGDWRGDGRVAELHLGVVDGALVGIDLRLLLFDERGLGVDLLLRDGERADGPEALEVALGVC